MQTLEPFFGSGPQIWSGGLSAPAIGWLPPSMLGAAPSTPGAAFSSPATMAPAPLGMTSMSSLPFSGPGAIPYVVPELITAPALISAVAARRGQPHGPTNDQETEDFVFDALELLPGASDVDVRCESGRVTLTGTVPHKRLKHDIGEIVWTLGVVNDVQNNLAIASRRRTRPGIREAETSVPARKQA